MKGEWTKERYEYMEGLAMDYGVDLDTVLALAEVLGPSEDRDGLIISLDDIEYFGWEV